MHDVVGQAMVPGVLGRSSSSSGEVAAVLKVKRQEARLLLLAGRSGCPGRARTGSRAPLRGGPALAGTTSAP